MRTSDTVVKHPVPPFTLCRHVTWKHNQVTPLHTPRDHTFRHCVKKIICAYSERQSDAEILNILKLPWDTQGITRFVTVSQAHIRT